MVIISEAPYYRAQRICKMCTHFVQLLAGPDQARLTAVYTCPATTHVRRTVVVRRSPAVFTSAGVSRLCSCARSAKRLYVAVSAGRTGRQRR
jgi:hypothetical protein